ncbi:MAG: hypothetical protein H7126_13875 [Candidatus Parcubacteria bacterium]|nr:hypothetical protein [Leptolyngbyaceae cyanobacterium LF-bin-113]
MNICSELRCPHAYKNGCDRFSVSNHCPVTYLCPGESNPDVRANQYWLFADDNAPVDINELRDRLQSQVLSTEASQQRLWAEAKYRENKPEMIWKDCAIVDEVMLESGL